MEVAKNGLVLAKILQKWLISISGEPLVVWTWLTPHCNQKTHFSISVSYISYVSDQRKWLKMAFLAEIWKNTEYSISGEVARTNLIDPNIFSSPTEALTFCIKSF